MNILLVVLAVVVCQICYSAAYPPDDKVMGTSADHRTTEGFEYMRRYGYLNRRPKGMTWGDYKSSMMKMQRMMHVPQSGAVDDETYAMMQKKRCGVPEGHVYELDDEEDWTQPNHGGPNKGVSTVGGSKNNVRPKRYVLSGKKWPWRDIWYTVTGYKTGINNGDFDEAVFNAFKKWSAVTTLTFTPTKCDWIDFEIYFGPASHGTCSSTFGSDTLAHAFFPNEPINGIYGDTHFNEAFTFAVRPTAGAGYDMEYVALHEFGHALGIKHSDVSDAVMYPYYDSNQAAITGGVLKTDDINAIQALYGDENTPYGTAAPLTAECTDTTKQF